MKGSAKGAAGGAAIGAIAGDAGTGAAIGTTAGAVRGRRQQKKSQKEAGQQAAQQTAQAQQTIAGAGHSRVSGEVRYLQTGVLGLHGRADIQSSDRWSSVAGWIIPEATASQHCGKEMSASHYLLR